MTLAAIAPLLLVPPTSRADAVAVAPPADDETLIYIIRQRRMLGAAGGAPSLEEDSAELGVKKELNCVPILLRLMQKGIYLSYTPAHVRILRFDLECQRCWFEHRIKACGQHFSCLREVRIDAVLKAITEVLGVDVLRRSTASAQRLLSQNLGRSK